MSVDETKKKSFPLHKAINYRNIAKITILLKKTRDINEKNEYGYSPLLYACIQEQNNQMLELLFEQKDIDPFVTDNEQQNAAHILAFKGQLPWIKKFFEKFPKVPVDELTVKLNTPLMLAAKMDHCDIIQYLYDRGANVNHQNDKLFTPLHYAANNGYIESTKKLIELGAQVNRVDDYGCTPLIKSCSWGFIETCKILMENGADIEPKGSEISALMQALQRDNLDVAKFLLEKGADANFAVKNDFISYTPLGTACSHKNVAAVKLLLTYGADVNFPGCYSQALFICMKKDFEQGIKILIDAGVNVNGRHTQSKRTVLETAKRLKKDNIVHVLQRYTRPV